MKIQIFALFLFLSSVSIFAQDTLGVKDLEQYTYHFSISSKGVMEGSGAEILMQNLKDHPVVLIGEYHGSPNISKLTASMMHEMNALGCNKFVAEVGPIASKYINEIIAENDDPFSTLQTFYKKHGNNEEPPFPFFDNEADKLFIDALKKYDWETWGIDQEFIDGYKMLVNRGFEMLNESQQKKMKPLMTEVIDSLNLYFEIDDNDGKWYSVSVNESQLIPKYFKQLSELNPKTNEIAEALFATNHIYYLNATKQYLDNNQTRITYMKKNMHHYLSTSNFDFNKDRMLLKMGGVHAGRGINPLEVFDIGNMMSELSEYHQRKSFHIALDYRYEIDENGALKDNTLDKRSWASSGKEIFQMGKKEQWTIVDLRPLRQDYFYKRKWVTNKNLDRIMEGYDIMIIAPAEDFN